MNLIKHSNGVTKREFPDQSQYPVRPPDKPSYQTPLMSHNQLYQILWTRYSTQKACVPNSNLNEHLTTHKASQSRGTITSTL